VQSPSRGRDLPKTRFQRIVRSAMSKSVFLRCAGRWWWIAASLYFAVHRFEDRLFLILRRWADPKFGTDAEWDFEHESKWAHFQNLFGLVCFMFLFLIGWFAVSSSWKFVIQFRLPKIRSKARFASRVFASFELGYRASSTWSALRSVQWWSLLYHGVACMSLVFCEHCEALLGILFLSEWAALLSNLFVILDLARFITHAKFSLLLESMRLVLLCTGSLRSGLEFDVWSLLLLCVMALKSIRDLIGLFRTLSGTHS